jgi:transcriptional regulator with GAF, ATPase, and Fis domain
LSTELLASELFGHVKGAFTGAMRDNPGRIATCDGGTLFLDEIGDLPLDLQPKLLRFVQDREYESVGDSVTKHADVRLIAATNINLEDAVRSGRFREDLLYRINVIQIDVPALRHRAEDIIPLAEHLIAELRGDKAITGFTDEAISALEAYNWPGNVRELRNVIERAVILCTGPGSAWSICPATSSRTPSPNWKSVIPSRSTSWKSFTFAKCLPVPNRSTKQHAFWKWTRQRSGDGARNTGSEINHLRPV